MHNPLRQNAAPTVPPSMSDTAMARSQVYGLLAALFRAEPSVALLGQLRGPALSGVFSELGFDLRETLQDKPEQELVEDLALEYTRLFLGPGPHISAHESVFVEVDGGAMGGLWGAKTVEVKAFIEASGLSYDSEYAGIPDHISVELEFLQKLAEWEAAKWAGNDSANAIHCLAVEKRFLEEHLNQWISKLCDKVIADAELPFYKEIGRLTRDFVEFDDKNTDEYLNLGLQH